MRHSFLRHQLIHYSVISELVLRQPVVVHFQFEEVDQAEKYQELAPFHEVGTEHLRVIEAVDPLNLRNKRIKERTQKFSKIY